MWCNRPLAVYSFPKPHVALAIQVISFAAANVALQAG